MSTDVPPEPSTRQRPRPRSRPTSGTGRRVRRRTLKGALVAAVGYV
ncbi:hypothetical protein ACFV29_43150 [Streptomyces sp. NPDC059690]